MLLVRYYLLLGIFVGVVVVPAVTRESNSPISTTTGSTTSSLSQDETSTSVTEETESSTDASTEASTSPSQNETSISEPKATESRANTTSSPSQNETSISVTKARESSTTTSKSTTTSSPSPNETPTSVTEVTESSTDTSTQSDTVTEPNGNNQSEATTYPSEVTSGTEISLNFTSEATLSEISTIDTISTSQINDLTTTREDIFEITEPTEKNNENGVSSITEIFTTTLSTTTSNAVTTTMSSTDTEYTTTSQSSNPAPITISDTVSTTPSIDNGTTITVNTTIVIPSSTTTASPDTTTLETSTNNTSTSVTTSTTVTTSTSPTTPTPPNLKIDLEITKINSTSFNVGWIVDNHYEKDNYSINITRNDSNKTCDSDDGTFAFDYRCCNYIYTKALPGFEYSIFIINSNQTKREMFASTTWIMPNQESALTCYKTDEITATTATIIMTKNTNLIDQPKYLKIIISNEDLIKEKYCLGNNDISNEYQSVKIDWSSLEDNFKVMLGENKACSEQATNCNRPLKPNQRYYVSFAFFYNNYYHIVSYKELSFITEKQSNLSLALGLTFGLIFVSAAGYFAVMLWRRGFLKKITLTWWHSTPDVHPDDDENRETLLCPRKAVIDDDGTSPKAVKVSEFVIHCEYLEENPEKQALQWEQLDAESKAFDVQYNTSFATLPENKRKNRYPNILPWDHCRVKLNIDEDDEICSDYINASYIKGASNKNEYIATQGPLAGTCRDFWKMVVQENVKIIVMVSKFIENNRDKCYKYFPKNHETMLVGEDIEVRCSTELHFGVYCVRTLQVRKDYTLVTVTHMQFLEWPDFGVPTGTENMLQFCHQLRNRWGNEGGLALVHCSAGVGRTGTLIATDILLQAIETESKISVYNTILEMRKQRKSMVQTQKQYMYIHQLIKSMLEDPIMPEPLNTEPVYENIIINVDQLKVEPIETAESAF